MRIVCTCGWGEDDFPVRGAEAFAVAAGRDAEMADESAAHALGSAEARIGGNGVERDVAACETAASLVEARALDELRRGEARFGHEVTREAALAHMGAGGERRHREIGARVFHDESADAGKALVLDALGGELRGELGLDRRGASDT